MGTCEEQRSSKVDSTEQWCGLWSLLLSLMFWMSNYNSVYVDAMHKLELQKRLPNKQLGDDKAPHVATVKQVALVWQSAACIP
jgi:hypothetical protein